MPWRRTSGSVFRDFYKFDDDTATLLMADRADLIVVGRPPLANLTGYYIRQLPLAIVLPLTGHCRILQAVTNYGDLPIENQRL